MSQSMTPVRREPSFSRGPSADILFIWPANQLPDRATPQIRQAWLEVVRENRSPLARL